VRPENISVYLFAGDKIIDKKVIGAADRWTCLFDKLPVFNSDGSTIQYRVVEGAIAKYYARYTAGLDSVNIINTHTPEVFKGEDGSQTIVVMDFVVPLGGNINRNQGDTIN